MKVSCTPVSVHNDMTAGKLTRAQYFELIASAGAEATDIVDPASYGWFWEDFDKDKAELPGLLRANGLKISAYAASNNFTVTGEENISMQIERVRNAIRNASELGIPLMRIFGGYHKTIGPAHHMDFSDGLQQIIRCIGEVLPEAEKNGVVLALENHGMLPGLPEEVLYIMEYFNSSHLGVCFDIANFTAFNMNEKVDAVEAYHLLKKYIRHVHCKDWETAPADSPRDTVGCACGEGNGIVPLRRLAYLMEKDRFQGYWALEYEGPVLDGVSRSIKYMCSLKESASLLYPEK